MQCFQSGAVFVTLLAGDTGYAIMAKKNDFDDWMDRYKWLRDTTDEAIAQRSAHAEFHGLEDELRTLQSALLDSYIRSKPIKHPRDKGDQREEILRHFLSKHGLLPQKYSVSSTRARVVAPSGHVSPEIDIVLHDYLETLVLKRFDTLEYYPIESVHGTIQVKSRLNKKALREGLDNIAKFKELEPSRPLEQRFGSWTASHGLYRRFGILFAFEYDLEWKKIVEEVEGFLAAHPNHLWPNLIVILDKGHFKIGSKDRYCWHQKDLQTLSEPMIHGFPDHEGHCLLNFYLILMDLLSASTAGMPQIQDYTRLPLTAGRYSYYHAHGAVSELGKCSQHGSYLRTLPVEAIERILAAVKDQKPINWIKATDLAFGEAGDNEEAYRRQPATVRIYNPDQLPLSDILARSDKSLTFDTVVIEGETIYLPWGYVDRDHLINTCPKCSGAKTKRSKKSTA